MSNKVSCLGCASAINTAPSLKAPYTIYICDCCGNYSLHNDLIRELTAGKDITPESHAFLRWLRSEAVSENLKAQGPLITENTLLAIRRMENRET